MSIIKAIILHSTMNLSIIVIFSLFICVVSDEFRIYYKHQLRGFRQEEQDREVGELIKHVSDSIVSRVFEKAKEGKLSFRFRVICDDRDDPNAPNINRILSKYEISCEDYTSSVLFILQTTFVDSNFTQSTKNGFDYHTITW